MNIKIQYQPTAKELARASIIFSEKKPFLMLVVFLVNLMVIFVFVALIALLFVQHKMSIPQWVALVASCAWLFGRKRFQEWVLTRRMQKSAVLEKPIEVDLSRNGIVWAGKGLKPGNLSWDVVKYIFEAKNGFILPYSFTRFLWLPFRGFASDEDIKQFRAIIKDRKLVHRVFSNWEC